MEEALFSFDDRAAGQRAAVRAMQLGLPADAVVLHVGERRPDEAIGSETDELLTGGFVGNIRDLLQRLFEWGETDAAAWHAHAQGGGAVLHVRSDSADERTHIEQAMQEEGARRCTAWRPMPAR